MTPEAIKMMFGYHIWANRQVWNCIDSISDDQYRQHSDYSIGSVETQLFHIMFTDWWAISAEMGTLPSTDDPAWLKQEQFGDRAALRAQWDAVDEQVMAYLETITADSLASFVSVPIGNGQSIKITRGEFLYSLINHATNHRAQTLRLIDELGGETAEQGVYFYYMQRQ